MFGQRGAQRPSGELAPLAHGVPSWMTYAIALASAGALAVDVILLIQAGGPTSVPGIAATYLLGAILLFLLATGARLGAAESTVLLLAVGIGVAALVGVAAGLLFSAVVGLGYLLAVCAGYAIYRLDRPSSGTREATDMQEQESVLDVRGVLEATDLFRGLTAEQTRQVARLGRLEMAHEGQILGREGTPAEALYVILDGHIELSARSAAGQTTVRLAGPGETLPLAALVGPGKLITTATAFNDATLLLIPRAPLLSLCTERPDIGLHLFAAASAILAERYRSMLRRHTASMDRALQQADLWANV